MITPDSHPLTYAVVNKAMVNGYFVAAHQRNGYVAVQILDEKNWRSTVFRTRGHDASVASDIELHTEKGWPLQLAATSKKVTMIELMVTPDSHPLTYAAVEKAMDNGYLVAAHRRDGYLVIQITDKAYWKSTAFQVEDEDKIAARGIALYTEEGWHRKLAS